MSYNPYILTIVLGITTLLFLTTTVGLAVWSVSLFQNRNFSDAAISEYTITNTANKKVSPNTAEAILNVKESGSDIPVLNTKLDAKIQKITSYLTSVGIDHTVNKNISEQYVQENLPNQRVVQGQIKTTFKNITDKPENLSNILNKTVELGVEEFYNISFSLDNTEAICTELEQQALEGLNQKIQNQNKALGVKKELSKKINSQNSCGDQMPNYPIPVAFDQRGKVGTEVSGSNIVLSEKEITLTSTYQATVKFR
jgi:uncharacterized protein YggE